MKRKRAAILAAEGQRPGKGRNALRAHREVVDGRVGLGVDCFDGDAAAFPDIVKATYCAIARQSKKADLRSPRWCRASRRFPCRSCRADAVS